MSTLAPRAARTTPREQFMPGIAATAYLFAVGTAFLAWHRQADSGPLWLDVLVWGAPTLVGAALTVSSRRDREQYVGRLVAAALMLPILQLFCSIDGPLVPGAGLALAVLGIALHILAFLAVRRRVPRLGG